MESFLAVLPEWARSLFYVALALGGAGMFIFSKNRPAASPPLSSAVASIGMELGNKEQMKELIEAVKGIEKAIRDEKQEELTDTIQDLMEELRRKHPD